MKKFAGTRTAASILVAVIVIGVSANAQPAARGAKPPRQSDPVTRLVQIIKRTFGVIVTGDMITTPKP